MKKILGLILVVFLSAGCLIQSINPYYTNDVVTESSTLLGTWDLTSAVDEQYAPNQITPWKIDTDEILTFDKKGNAGPLTYKTFNIDGQVFLDVTPANNDSLKVSNFWMYGVMPTHILLRVNITEDQLTLTPLNYDWFTTKKAKKLKLSTVKVADENWYIYNPTPVQWVKFLKQHKNEQNLFSEKNKIVLKRRSI